MDPQVIQLKKDFYQQIMTQHSYTFPNTSSTLSLLTDEELEQIERVWIELIMWKKSQTH
ncbi:hypothetical protein [Vibrio mangrovi]|uniref:3-demethylubiquinone-9 3-methyltransferase n=1 Tax=Vibrio mangrovi TaxID=474394 RepID=A0ABU4I7D7_9VIBR|nr:hypothetical protein [Vibrio mangrovi]MDW6003866.1 hypothetical protein [Vibrio mangrovi]